MWDGFLEMVKNRPTKPAQKAKETASLGRLGPLGRKWNIRTSRRMKILRTPMRPPLRKARYERHCSAS